MWVLRVYISAPLELLIEQDIRLSPSGYVGKAGRLQSLLAIAKGPSWVEVVRLHEELAEVLVLGLVPQAANPTKGPIAEKDGREVDVKMQLWCVDSAVACGKEVVVLENCVLQ